MNFQIERSFFMKALSDLHLGDKGFVKYLTAEGTAKRRMLDLGIVPNTKIEAIMKSPSGDPTAYLVRGAVIAIRREEAEMIILA